MTAAHSSRNFRALHFQRHVLAGFLLAACVYLFFLEPWGHDTWFHLQRLHDVEGQLEWGHLRAHFAENAAQGKGLPVWIYYSQWVYWPALLLTALGASSLIALKLVYIASLLLCSVGCYRLLRLHADARDAGFGTLLFMTSNYVIGEVFQRSAYAEFMSVSFLPFVLAALHHTVRQGGLRSGAAFALFASLMILCHPLSFMNSGVILVAYAAFVAIEARIPIRRLVRAVPPFVLALGVTAFYWLPAVVETPYVMAGEGARTPLSDTFLSIGSYLNFSGITNLGFVLSLMAPVVAFYLLRHVRGPETHRERASWPLVVAVLVYFLLTLRVSEPLYDHVPLLAANLWVWRVLFQMTLLVVILVTAYFGVLPVRLRNDAARIAIACMAILQAVALVVWNTAPELSTRHVGLREIEEQVAVESRRVSDFGIDEYLPNLRRIPRPGENCRVVRSVAPDGRYEMSIAIPAEDAEACIHVPRYWNTRFAAWIDGEETSVYANTDGEILLAPAGRTGQLELRFTQPRYVTLSSIVSVVSVAVLVLLVIGVPRRRRVAGDPQASMQDSS